MAKRIRELYAGFVAEAGGEAATMSARTHAQQAAVLLATIEAAEARILSGDSATIDQPLLVKQRGLLRRGLADLKAAKTAKRQQHVPLRDRLATTV